MSVEVHDSVKSSVEDGVK